MKKNTTTDSDDLLFLDVLPELSTAQHKGLDIIVIKIHDLAGDDVPTTFLHVTNFCIIILYFLHSR